MTHLTRQRSAMKLSLEVKKLFQAQELKLVNQLKYTAVNGWR